MWAMRWFPTLILNLLQFHQCYHLTASGNITSVTGLDSLVVFVVIINNNIINNNLWMSSILHHGKDALCQIRYFIWCNLYFSIPFVFCFELFQSEFFFNFSLWPSNWKNSPSAVRLCCQVPNCSVVTYRLICSWEEIGRSQISLLFEVIHHLSMSKGKKQRLITFSSSQQFT